MGFSFGNVEPNSKQLLSGTESVAELAKATLAVYPKLDWTAWTADYSKVRDAIAESYPQWFKAVSYTHLTLPTIYSV